MVKSGRARPRKRARAETDTDAAPPESSQADSRPSSPDIIEVPDPTPQSKRDAFEAKYKVHERSNEDVLGMPLSSH